MRDGCGLMPPVHQFNPSVVLFNQCAATFDPVAAVVVRDASHTRNRRRVNMAAHNAVHAVHLSVMRHRFLKFADEADGVFDAALGVGAQRPVGQAELVADKIERDVGPQQRRVAKIAEVREPFRVGDDGVKFVAVHHEQPPAIGGFMNRLRPDGNIAVDTGKVCAELVVIAGNPNHFRAFARFAEQFLDHVVVRLRPIPVAPQVPQVHNVADQIQPLAVVAFQKLQYARCVAMPGAEVQIGNPDGFAVHDTGSIAKRRDDSASIMLRNGAVTWVWW